MLEGVRTRCVRLPYIWLWLHAGFVANKDILLTLCDLAHGANALAKQLAGSHRSSAYRMKAQVLSLLITEGLATVDGVQNGTVGLTILAADSRLRLHVPKTALSPAARTIVREQSRTAPAVASLAECLAARRLAA